MASSSSAPIFTLLNVIHMVQVKLEGPNYMSWLSQIVPLLKTNELMGILDGSEPSPPPFVIDPTDAAKQNCQSYSCFAGKEGSIYSQLDHYHLG
jgi:hypothetical protein